MPSPYFFRPTYNKSHKNGRRSGGGGGGAAAGTMRVTRLCLLALLGTLACSDALRFLQSRDETLDHMSPIQADGTIVQLFDATSDRAKRLTSSQDTRTAIVGESLFVHVWDAGSGSGGVAAEPTTNGTAGAVVGRVFSMQGLMSRAFSVHSPAEYLVEAGVSCAAVPGSSAVADGDTGFGGDVLFVVTWAVLCDGAAGPVVLSAWFSSSATAVDMLPRRSPTYRVWAHDGAAAASAAGPAVHRTFVKRVGAPGAHPPAEAVPFVVFWFTQGRGGRVGYRTVLFKHSHAGTDSEPPVLREVGTIVASASNAAVAAFDATVLRPAEGASTAAASTAGVRVAVAYVLCEGTTYSVQSNVYGAGVNGSFDAVWNTTVAHTASGSPAPHLYGVSLAPTCANGYSVAWLSDNASTHGTVVYIAVVNAATASTTASVASDGDAVRQVATMVLDDDTPPGSHGDSDYLRVTRWTPRIALLSSCELLVAHSSVYRMKPAVTGTLVSRDLLGSLHFEDATAVSGSVAARRLVRTWTFTAGVGDDADGLRYTPDLYVGGTTPCIFPLAGKPHEAPAMLFTWSDGKARYARLFRASSHVSGTGTPFLIVSLLAVLAVVLVVVLLKERIPYRCMLVKTTAGNEVRECGGTEPEGEAGGRCGGDHDSDDHDGAAPAHEAPGDASSSPGPPPPLAEATHSRV